MDAIEQLKQDVRAGRIDVERLLDVIVTLQRQLKAAQQRIEELEKKAGGTATVKVDEPFSMRAEEKRQQARRQKKKHKRARKGRRGRLTSADKLKRAERTEKCFPEGLSEKDCQLSHTRPVWRLENGRAVLIAYEIYRGPKNRYGKIPGVIGRSEFGLEIVVEIGRDSLPALRQPLIVKGLRRIEWTEWASGARTNGRQLLVPNARRLRMISTPEALVLRARQQFDALLALVEAAKDERIDRVEGQIFAELLSLGLTLLRRFVAQHGTGDAGPPGSCARRRTWSTRCGARNGPRNGRHRKERSSGPRCVRKATAQRSAAGKWCWPTSAPNWIAAIRRNRSRRWYSVTGNEPCGRRSRRCGRGRMWLSSTGGTR